MLPIGVRTVCLAVVLSAAAAAYPAEFTGFMHGVGIDGWLANYKRPEFVAEKMRGILTLGDYEHFESFVTRADVERIAKTGADHIRVAVDQTAIVDERGDMRKRVVAKLDEFVGWCETNRLNVVLDMHRVDGNERGNLSLFEVDSMQHRFSRMWLQLEAHYSSKKFIAFELLNEPQAVDPRKWNSLVSRVVGGLRAVNKERIIIVGPVFWNDPKALEHLYVTNDPKVVYAFHMYKPLEFTHQRSVLDPDVYYYNRGMPYPTTDVERYRDFRRVLYSDLQPYRDEQKVDRAFLMRRMYEAIAFLEDNPKAVLWCGEFGVVDHADLAWREAWMSDVAWLCRKHGIGYCAWSYLSRPGDIGSFSLCDPSTRELLSPAFADILAGKPRNMPAEMLAGERGATAR